jgi:large subunit ribosomal protein L24
MRIKKNDTVRVLSGKDRGKSGKVVRALPQEDKVVVEGINMRTRHKRTTKNTKQGGGIITFSAPLHVSNVALIDPKKDAPTRVGYRKDEKTGKVVRYAKKSGVTLA